MVELVKLIQDLAAAETAALLRDRRALHRQPELSFREFQTSAYIQKRLTELGIAFTTGWAAGPNAELPGKTGIRALLRLGNLDSANRPTLALRADFDALPITEETGLDFASENPGVMHACGHDGHTAMLLSAASILQTAAKRWPVNGDVVLIFQPAEELAPGGAQAMIAEGALRDPTPMAIFGQHVNPNLPAGTIGFRSGLMMAAVDDFEIVIRGTGGHAAGPQNLIDPIPIAAQVILALQTLVSRRADPISPSVLSIGRVEALGAYNVIPDSVLLKGTFRSIDPAWREQAMQLIKDLVTQLAASFGAAAEFRRIQGYPPLINNAELCAFARQAAETYVGADRVVDLPLVMWAEDFAYYGQAVPANFYNLGIGNAAAGWTRPLHNSRLMIDESALPLGAGFLAYLAFSYLSTEAQAAGVVG